jgi:hypothetical protein
MAMERAEDDRPGWLEVVAATDRPDVKDPEPEQPPEPRDEPRHEPLPGQMSFLDALEVKQATAEEWGVRVRRRRKKSNTVQSFLFLGAEA